MNKYREKLMTQLRNIVDTNVGDYLWLMPDEAAELLHALRMEALQEVIECDADACERLLAAASAEPTPALKKLFKE